MQQGQRDQTESNLADNDVELFMRGVIDFDNKKNRKRTGFKGRKTQKGKDSFVLFFWSPCLFYAFLH